MRAEILNPDPERIKAVFGADTVLRAEDGEIVFPEQLRRRRIG